jgi:hypothetical protein
MSHRCCARTPATDRPQLCKNPTFTCRAKRGVAQPVQRTGRCPRSSSTSITACGLPIDKTAIDTVAEPAILIGLAAILSKPAISGVNWRHQTEWRPGSNTARHVHGDAIVGLHQDATRGS